MSEWTDPTPVTEVRCDAGNKNGCDEVLDVRHLESTGWDEKILAAMTEAGWTRWSGRSRLDYCPRHEPRDGHRMVQIRPRGGGGRSLLTSLGSDT